MNIPDKSDFQPSAETLKKWLSARKPTLMVGGIAMPAFFSDTGNSSDTTWFYVAVIGEIMGLLTTVYGGARSGGIFLILALLAIVMFIFLDFFFAVRLHRKKATECELHSRRLLLDDSEKDKILKLELELNSGKIEDLFYKAGIVFIAFIKIIGIVLLGVFNNIILYLPFAIIYLIVAYVHLRHTGYYFAYVSTENAIDKEHKMFANGHYKANEPDQPVVTPTPLRRVPIRHTPHEIVEEHGQPLHYLIKTKGVLTDNDVINLIAGQEDSNKIALFKACRKLQLENIEGNPTMA